MDSSPNLTLPYIIAAQAQKHVTHNEAIRALDALVQLMVLDKDLASPPGSPAAGSRYIVASSPSGAWAGQAGKVAAYQDGGWAFFTPREGWLAWVADEDKIYYCSGSAWAVLPVSVANAAFADFVASSAPSTPASGIVRTYAKTDKRLYQKDDAGLESLITPNGAAFDAMAYTGLEINGGMEVSQENGTTAVALATGAEAYVVDQWTAKFVRAATLACSAQQMSSPTPPAGLQKWLQLKATTGLGSLATGDYAYLATPIEGYRAARLGFGAAGAQAVTLGFWVYASIAGTMTVALQNSAANRTYPVNVTINNANTAEWKTVTIPGDTGGSWMGETNIGVRAIFCFGSGATNQGTAASWNADGKFATSSTTNFMATTNNIACIAGVQILPGSEAALSARSQNRRHYDDEVRLCQRYFERVGAVSVGKAVNATSLEMGISFTVRKRMAPSFALISGLTSQVVEPGVAARTITAIGSPLNNSDINVYFNTITSSSLTTGALHIGFATDWLFANARM